MLQIILIGTQLFFSCIIGVYFWMQLKNNHCSRENIEKDSKWRKKELQNLRDISLNKPLSEKLRPQKEEDIIGQSEGMKALKMALCGPNPQHILIYGSPGVGKTAAARIALEIAKCSYLTPFKSDAKFVELDATTLRFDERSIADPLMGSVHDPIYQGAGAYGQAGIPQPKPGAVTKAHGGVLFIDEIGELQGVQMNKLLKVLEDRKVMLQSSYYSKFDKNIPSDIHDIFLNGLPADFRLIGATTRSPEAIPPALRSRCTEIFFKELTIQDISQLIEHLVTKEKIKIEKEASDLISHYVMNGRAAVNVLQTAYSLIQLEARECISARDIEWVLLNGRYTCRMKPPRMAKGEVGSVNGIGVLQNGEGVMLRIEAVVKKVEEGGELKVTGIIEEEEFEKGRGHVTRKSMILNSIENILTVLKIRYNIKVQQYFVHIDFNSSIPIDGPSAGLSLFIALYSALFEKVVPAYIAMTGAISITGEICPVGGIYEKALAAKQMGIKKLIIPKENKQKLLETIGIEIIPVETIEEVIHILFDDLVVQEANTILHA